MSNISVIIPIYNVEAYLPQCLDSIVNQTYRNLEIILVNDGSTDSSPQICEEYAAKDPRIKVIHKKNGGSSEARNLGLTASTGTYISFVDSDDFIADQFYHILIAHALVSEADIVECGFISFTDVSEINQPIKQVELQDLPLTYGTEEALKLIMEGPLSVVVWNKIYKKEVVKDILFPVGKYIDDEYWTYKVFGKAQNVVKIPDVLYYYRQQTESIMGRKYSLRRLDGLEALEERGEYMKKYFPGLAELAEKKFCFGCMFHYHQLSINKELDPQKNYRKNILKKIKGFNRRFTFKTWHWKEIVWYQLFILAPQAHKFLSEYIDSRVENRKKQGANV